MKKNNVPKNKKKVTAGENMQHTTKLFHNLLKKKSDIITTFTVTDSVVKNHTGNTES